MHPSRQICGSGGRQFETARRYHLFNDLRLSRLGIPPDLNNQEVSKRTQNGLIFTEVRRERAETHGRALVRGPRDRLDRSAVYDGLSEITQALTEGPPVGLIVGRASSVDSLAASWAKA